MTTDPIPPMNEPTEPFRYRNFSFLGTADLGNSTPDELAWPVVAAKANHQSTFLCDLPDTGNPTEDELTWPVVSSGERISPKRQEPIPLSKQYFVESFVQLQFMVRQQCLAEHRLTKNDGFVWVLGILDDLVPTILEDLLTVDFRDSEHVRLAILRAVHLVVESRFPMPKTAPERLSYLRAIIHKEIGLI